MVVIKTNCDSLNCDSLRCYVLLVGLVLSCLAELLQRTTESALVLDL